ncbi:MAG: glycosyl hydrolase-related protein, partial [Clostridia bacterium]|nr:glycosyl hydrolase-related protein [Clostridia bacterium]
THENTSCDAAKFDVCAHKWADRSEEGYGVSILNNCKYGHSVSGSEMTITMIKCGVHPNTENDHGEHIFTYAFYPHAGDFRHGGTIAEAYKLNRPLEAAPAKGCGKLPASYSLVSADCENVIIETVKQAEDGKGIIVRMYEAWNKKSTVTLNLGFDAKKISLCDLMENKISEIGAGKEVKVPVSNFEIVTLYIEV